MLTVSCARASTISPPVSPAPTHSASAAPSPSPSPAKSIRLFSVEKALEHARALSVDIGPRPTGSEGERRALDYITAAFKQAGWDVTHQTFKRADGGSSANVIARLASANYSSGYVVVGGHYDTIAGSPGGNDNASGIAVLLALAESLSATDLPIELVAFAAEEIHPASRKHHEGSRANASSSDKSLIRAMLSIDMVGAGPKVLVVADREAPSPLQGELLEIAKSIGVPTGSLERGDISDHTSYSRLGIPAVLLWTGQHETFHKRTDTFDVVQPEALQRAGTLTLEWIRRRYGQSS